MTSEAGEQRIAAGLACGIAAGALWGLVFLAPVLVRGFSPLELAAGRYLAFGALAALLAAPRRRALAAGLTRRDWAALAWLGLTGNTLYYVLLAAAVQGGGVAMTSLVIGFLPVVVTAIGTRDPGAVPLRALAPSLLLCLAGAACIAWHYVLAPASTAGGNAALGFACAVGALLSWTAFAVGNSRCLARRPHLSAHDWNLLTGLATGMQALALAPVALLMAPGGHGAGDWARFAAVSLGVALLASVAGNALWNRMSRLLPLTLAGQMILFETLFALLYAFGWERRLPHPLELAAFALVVAGVVTALHAHRPRPASPAMA